MAATRVDIDRWFEAGKKQKATHLIVVVDDFDHDDYPAYVAGGQDVREVAKKYDGTNMQRIMEVYSLKRDKHSQLAEFRAFHYD